MDELIKRLSEATEGSEELDEQVCEAVLVPAMPMRLVGGPAIDIPMWRYPDGTIGTALRFTRSIDAALTLVPIDHRLSLLKCRRYNGEEWEAEIECPASIGDGGWSLARSAPLALCIAALRAKIN